MRHTEPQRTCWLGSDYSCKCPIRAKCGRKLNNDEELWFTFLISIKHCSANSVPSALQPDSSLLMQQAQWKMESDSTSVNPKRTGTLSVASYCKTEQYCSTFIIWSTGWAHRGGFRNIISFTQKSALSIYFLWFFSEIVAEPQISASATPQLYLWEQNCSIVILKLLHNLETRLEISSSWGAKIC